MNEGPRFIEEKPRVVEHDETNQRILEWIQRDGTGLRVGGLFGPRGSGKTSRMLSLLHRVYGERAIDRAHSELILDPSDVGRSHVAIALIRHLLEAARLQGLTLNEDHVKATMGLLAKAAEPDHYTQLAREYGSTSKHLDEKLSEAWRDLAEAPFSLRTSIRSLLNGSGRAPSTSAAYQRVTIAIDDFDLCPDQAYNLLEWITWHLTDSPVTVLVASEKAELQLVVEQELERRRGPRGVQAAAVNIMRKWIPVSWQLWPIDARERMGWYDRVRGRTATRAADPSVTDSCRPTSRLCLSSNPTCSRPVLDGSSRGTTSCCRS
jgi:hypothetical protein